MEDKSPPQRAAPKGIISLLLSSAGRAMTTLLASLLFSLITGWVGMAFFWPDQGAQHSHLLMNHELHWFSANVRQSLLMADPVGQLNVVLVHTWQWLFIDTKFVEWLGWVKGSPDAGWLYRVDDYLRAAIYITLTFVLRVFILLLTAPLFVLAAFTGIVDGLVRRDIRRFGSGYESGFVYHHAKHMVMPVFYLAWMVYLTLPFSVPPFMILLPAAFLFGLSISIMVGTFKKYI
ncbi:MAG: TIGR03747 family integrating conjugative element membrane protein [Scandinavium sp.]|uniref:TIGR03747 family integrating conjugative element membrane protein n=1 Tax=Scandinavium sp. TaxID=2830653 RepID=UPI003F2FD5C4